MNNNGTYIRERRLTQNAIRAFALLMFLFPASLLAQIYVSPAGADSNSGSFEQPFLTINKALSVARADSIIYLRGGTYFPTPAVDMSDSGAENHYIKLWAYPGEFPVIDFSQEISSTDGIRISGSFYYLKGIEEKNARHNGIYITGNNNIVENCRIHGNGNTGLHMRHGASNNLILNCDSYYNYDPPIGGNADGFSAKWEVGTGNVFRGCRSFNNSDDGWDLWMGINTVTIESCWAFRNGVDSWYSGQFNGNGNGFKLGGSNVPTHHIVKNCIAFDNAGNGGRGFDENNNLAGQTIYNCTSYRNKGGNFILANTLTQGQHDIRNCVSIQGGVYILDPVDTIDSWTLGMTVTNSDFQNLDTSLALAARDTNGYLPSNSLFRLAPGSQLIDAGVDVGIPFNGNAPDLGAIESPGTTAVHLPGSTASVPAQYYLGDNYPNPFNPSTTIAVGLPERSHVELRVFDMLGREIAVLANGVYDKGYHNFTWSGKTKEGIPAVSGIYFYKIEYSTNGRVSSDIRKMVLTK
jgi:hypothetical protein